MRPPCPDCGTEFDEAGTDVVCAACGYVARFSARREAIRAMAEAVKPPDSFVVLSDNLSHIGNGTFRVSVKVERDEPLTDPEPPDSCGEGGDDPHNETVASVLVRPGHDLIVARELLRAKVAEAVA